MTETLAESVVRRLQPAPFWDHVGAALVDASPGRAVVRIPRRAEFGRSGEAGGSAHGGIVAAALDMAASCAMLTMLGEGDGRRATVDLSVHYLAPANGDLVATATIRRSGGRIATIDIELESEGVLAALGRATFMIIRPQGSG